MSSENRYCAQQQVGPLGQLNAVEPQPMQVPMNPKLTDSDRKAVDFFLDGEEPSLDSDSPMARSSFMDRVHAVRRLLGLLDSMPSEAPSTDLLETTLAHLPVHNGTDAAQSTGSQPSA